MFKGKVLAGLKVLEHMRTKGELVVLADVAEDIAIGCSYAEQIFRVLREAGIVKGMRGPGGGYMLAKTESGSIWLEDWKLIDSTELFYQDDDNGTLSLAFMDTALNDVLVDCS